MSTIEGGMICTNDKNVYKILRIIRSHGMLRESGDRNYEKKLIRKILNYLLNLFFYTQLTM